jgi:hypothetical protein
VGALGAGPGCSNSPAPPAVSGPILRGSIAGHSGGSGQAGFTGSHAGTSAGGSHAGGSGGTTGGSGGGSSGRGAGGRGGSGGIEVGSPGGAGAGEAGEENGAGAAGKGESGQAGQGGANGEAGAGGENGTAHEHVFHTITALYDAIDGAQIANGEAWSVSWASDAHVAAGALSGTLTASQPTPSVLDQGPLPLKLFAASDWTAYENESGSYHFDADGYPVIELGTSTGDDYQALYLNATRYAFHRFTLANLRIAQDLTGAADLSGISFRLADAAEQNYLIGNHFVEVGGTTTSVALDYVTSGTQTLTGGQPATTSDRVFEGIWSLFPASPTSATLTMTMELESLTGDDLGSDSADVPGQGDWSTNTGLAYAPVFGLYRAAGGSGTSSATALTFQVQRYQP